MKPQPKAAAKAQKPATKAKTVKTAAKAVATTGKVVSKAPAKAVAKPSATASAKAKPVAKPAAKTQPAAKAKPAPKPAAKAPAKPAAKTAAKAPARKAAPKAVPAKTQTPVAKKAAPTKKTPIKQPAKASIPSTPVAARPAPAGAPIATDPLQRATRPSARLAQITVPGMAQTVASTAAKASYAHSPAMPVLTPPPLVAVKKDPKLANNWKTKPLDQLTDAEVLAMPDGEYMNDTQMAFFRLKLSQLKQDILNSAGETTEHLREDTVVVPDPADRATIEEEHALELRTRDRERKLLKKIEQSISRIDAGDYGYCDETGEPIGVGRLLARPTATLSLEAQQRRELKQKMFGD